MRRVTHGIPFGKPRDGLLQALSALVDFVVLQCCGNGWMNKLSDISTVARDLSHQGRGYVRIFFRWGHVRVRKWSICFEIETDFDVIYFNTLPFLIRFETKFTRLELRASKIVSALAHTLENI